MQCNSNNSENKNDIARARACPSGSLVFASPSNLGLESTFNRVHRSPRSTRLARNEEDTVFLGQYRIR